MPQIRQRRCLVTTADVTSPSAPTTPDPWAAVTAVTAVTAVILGAQGRFSGGLAVEVLTLAGVVYSRNVGGFTTATYAPVASASKMVSASVFLRFIERGTLSLLRFTTGRPASYRRKTSRRRSIRSFAWSLGTRDCPQTHDNVTSPEGSESDLSRSAATIASGLLQVA